MNSNIDERIKNKKAFGFAECFGFSLCKLAFHGVYFSSFVESCMIHVDMLGVPIGLFSCS